MKRQEPKWVIPEKVHVWNRLQYSLEDVFTITSWIQLFIMTSYTKGILRV